MSWPLSQFPAETIETIWLKTNNAGTELKNHTPNNLPNSRNFAQVCLLTKLSFPQGQDWPIALAKGTAVSMNPSLSCPLPCGDSHHGQFLLGSFFTKRTPNLHLTGEICVLQTMTEWCYIWVLVGPRIQLKRVNCLAKNQDWKKGVILLHWRKRTSGGTPGEEPGNGECSTFSKRPRRGCGRWEDGESETGFHLTSHTQALE